MTDACRGCVARPCTTSCPKGAVQVRDGRARIDPEACVSCGKCLSACPFAAVMDRSHMIDVLSAIGRGERVVAAGAEEVAAEESRELLERLEDGAPFMTSSCCPAYTATVERHLPGLKPYVSHTESPYGRRRSTTCSPSRSSERSSLPMR